MCWLCLSLCVCLRTPALPPTGAGSNLEADKSEEHQTQLLRSPAKIACIAPMSTAAAVAGPQETGADINDRGTPYLTLPYLTLPYLSYLNLPYTKSRCLRGKTARETAQ